MNKVVIGVSALSVLLSSGVACAGQLEDLTARLDRLERENAAIRKENAALLENRRLRDRNAKLKMSEGGGSAMPPTPAVQAAAKSSEPAIPLADARLGENKTDPFEAYASASYRASHAPAAGKLKLWGEGGAIWSGGDSIFQDSSVNGTLFGTGSANPFDLTPKVGWETAGGFDYRFGGSPWHISGQLRYGESGKVNGQSQTSASVDYSFFGAGRTGTVSFSDAFGASYKETHWLADIAIGRDVLGTGSSALQVKGGLRVAGFETRQSTSDVFNETFANINPPLSLLGTDYSNLSGTQLTQTETRNSFLGAGPRVGVEGAVPFAGKWSLDYLGDVAVLFGMQRSVTTSSESLTSDPAAYALLLGSGLGSTTSTSDRFTTLFNADLQFGFSYWIAQDIKLGASYRLDALINTQDSSYTPNRFTHGPRLTLSGQFDAQ